MKVVFPTHVGVFLYCQFTVSHGQCLPHARGGVSGELASPDDLHLSSPRTWGCFSFFRLLIYSKTVFPTHVGVFLKCTYTKYSVQGLPHARGGVSKSPGAGRNVISSSPRTWGCFRAKVRREDQGAVFPTHVGVFPIHAVLTGMVDSLPHARGGVSEFSFGGSIFGRSSPRTWGCFWQGMT